MKNILIRSDSSFKLGIGHIMRDLVLANEYLDDNVIFVCQNLEGNINNKILELNYKVEILFSNKLEELDSLIKRLKVNLLIIDHYSIDYFYEKELKQNNLNLKILSFDDTYKKHFCDILLNHNVYADAKKYKGLVPHNCEIRCGEEFTLIRKEFFSQLKKEYKINKTTILISMGGTDHSNINIKILKVLEAFNNIEIKVVTTMANKNLKELKTYIKKFDNMNLFIDSNEIAKLIKSSSFSIVSSSVIVNEILYLNSKFIAIKTAENQKMMYEYLKENLYDVLEKFEDVTLKNILKKFV